MKKIIALFLSAVLLLGVGAVSAAAEDGLADQIEDKLHASIQREENSPEWITALPYAQDESITQLFVVAGFGTDKTTATVSMHERDENGAWKQILSTPGYVGKRGLCPDAAHVEGCGQTPMGVYRFNKAFGIAPDPGCAIPYTQVTDDIWWSGDPREGMRYNEMVDIKEYPELAKDDSEHIVEYEYPYQYCLNISFNEDGTPGRGSAIFLHCFGTLKPYTGGCVSLPENIMKLVMQRVKPECVVVIDTLEHLSPATWKDWGFEPTLVIDCGDSELYTQAELDDAVERIKAEFAAWEGCELHSIRYAGDESCTEENLKWMNELNEDGNYTQVVEFLMDFHSPAEQLDGWAWTANMEYTDYQWWLARSADGSWDIVTFGH
jgi:L,D-peptidoglycan transpeptidase YkuD (ErfK/YbiS/YcfS/YnhG family)